MLTAAKPDSSVAKTPGAKDENMMTMMNKQMQFMMPIMTIFIGISLPSGLMLYWFVNLLLTLLEQKMIFSAKK
ncbi:MAG: YidC/Oxa1 family membrane protein insertase [Patescibacteria group bacterium]|nr:YidC/Oxa1 family membrane protein insertase [Patescibacteria group bacterium]